MSKDYYWATTKKEYLNRLSKWEGNSTAYYVWDYLRAYIIRGKTDNPDWDKCYYLYNSSRLLSARVSLNKIANNLQISPRTVARTLKILNDKNYIIIHTGFRNNTSNKTNIYILGFTNRTITELENVTMQENYFIDAPNGITEEQRDRVIKLFTVDRNIKLESIKLQKSIFDKAETAV